MMNENSRKLDQHRTDILRLSLQKMISEDVCNIRKNRDICERDLKYILQYLSQAIALDSPILFQNFTAWLADVLINKKIPVNHLRISYDILQKGIYTVFPGESWVDPFFAGADGSFNMVQESREGDILPPENTLSGQYIRYVIRADRNKARQIVMKALQEGMTISDLYLNVFEPCQRMIGRLWQTSVINVAQEHYATAVTQMIMSELYPRIFTSEKNGRKMAAFCIGSELHELGIRMVADFFEMDGWDTSFFGANAPIPDMLKTLRDEIFDLIAVSTTMMVHLKTLQVFIHDIRVQDPLKTMKIMVGGYPFLVDGDLWEKVGADGTAKNAPMAVKQAAEWFGL
ncbi:MAG: MerR family transcriptional regulator, light-induced transcriptional regulator [Candidatus Marinimicrobia bacterium]|nr:MerR family transcriptional regulator, light-induced transcriptional regulator [Candidatus Neomarinimicrobiota bacterium]